MSRIKVTIYISIIFSILFLVCTVLLFAEEQFVYDAKGKRDPFTTLVTSDGRLLKLDQEDEAGIANLSLEGIIYDKNGLSYAIVNGEVVKVGDFISDYQVLKIEKDRMIFIKDGQPVEVELKKEGE